MCVCVCAGAKSKSYLHVMPGEVVNANMTGRQPL